jgi:hypothetical protein
VTSSITGSKHIRGSFEKYVLKLEGGGGGSNLTQNVVDGDVFHIARGIFIFVLLSILHH